MLLSFESLLFLFSNHIYYTTFFGKSQKIWKKIFDFFVDMLKGHGTPCPTSGRHETCPYVMMRFVQIVSYIVLHNVRSFALVPRGFLALQCFLLS